MPVSDPEGCPQKWLADLLVVIWQHCHSLAVHLRLRQPLVFIKTMASKHWVMQDLNMPCWEPRQSQEKASPVTPVCCSTSLPCWQRCEVLSMLNAALLIHHKQASRAHHSGAGDARYLHTQQDSSIRLIESSDSQGMHYTLCCLTLPYRTAGSATPSA